MSHTNTFGAMIAVALLASLPVLAQQTTDAPSADSQVPPSTVPATPPGTPPATPPASSSATPADSSSAATPATSQQGVVATTNNPNLAVATLKLENGTRASKLIGSAVYNEGSEKVGTVDDLIMTRDDKVTMAIVSVGGFIGIGSKLVAVPWSQLRMDADKIVLAGATKDSLNGMPNFQY